ncbi:MAG: TerB family tellurite resistance protein [Candidatus Eisenbacteria bacterium]
MRDPSLETKLLQTLAALAWADGNVEERERTFLRGLIAEYGLGPHEADEVLALLDRPVSIDEFREFARGFAASGSEADRSRLLARAEHLIEADGTKDKEELRYLSLLRGWMGDARGGGHASGDAGLFGGLGRTRHPGGNLRAVKGLFSGTGVEPSTSPRDAFVVLFGAILYRVIYADRVVDAAEAERLRSLLAERFGFAPGEVDTMLRLIQQRVADDHDRQRLCAEFNRITGPEERQDLLAALFEIAKSDGEVSREEEDEIRVIANYLWVEVQDYVAIRKKVIGR